MKNLLNRLLIDTNEPTQHWDELKHEVLNQVFGSPNEILTPILPLDYEVAFYDVTTTGELLLYVPVNQDLNFDQESRKLNAIIIVFSDLNRTKATVVLHWCYYLINIMEDVNEDELAELLIQPNKAWWFKEKFAYRLGDVYNHMLEWES